MEEKVMVPANDPELDDLRFAVRSCHPKLIYRRLVRGELVVITGAPHNFVAGEKLRVFYPVLQPNDTVRVFDNEQDRDDYQAQVDIQWKERLAALRKMTEGFGNIRILAPTAPKDPIVWVDGPTTPGILPDPVIAIDPAAKPSLLTIRLGKERAGGKQDFVFDPTRIKFDED